MIAIVPTTDLSEVLTSSRTDSTDVNSKETKSFLSAFNNDLCGGPSLRVEMGQIHHNEMVVTRS